MIYELIVYLCASVYCLIVHICFYIGNNKKLKNAKTELETEKYTNVKNLIKGAIIIFSIGIIIELCMAISLALK